MPARPHLGDSHNFGRRVSLRRGRVAKPRALLWEWLLLATESPLRRFLADAAERVRLGPGAFDFLPSLKFFPARSGVGGEVERLALEPLGTLSREAKRGLATITGRSLALWSWFGVTDLHWENLALGADARGRVVFGPLDVEMILGDLDLPTDTKLLPDADPEYAEICRHACGVRRVLPYLGKPLAVSDLLAMAFAYDGTLAFLERHARGIAEVFGGLPRLRETPIRVCLRGTDEYVRAREVGPEALWPPLLDAEAAQLARGDIPYFFRLYGRRGIHYYGDRALRRIETLPLAGDNPQPDPILSLSRGLRSPARKTLREEGLLTVLGAFDHSSFSGTHQAGDLEVTFRARALTVKRPGGEEIHAKRDLSAFVASVYLPCHCGEVRDVLVPPVTRCDARP